MSTVRKVAEVAGVSPATVSRALRGDPRISRATTERVVRAADRIGYRPRRNRSPGRSTGAVRRVEMVIFGVHEPVPDHDFFGEIHRSACEALRKRGFALQAAGPHARAEIPSMYERILNASDVDGFLLGWEYITPEFARELTNRSIPFVIIGTDLPNVSVNLVGFDEFHGGYLAAKHLIRAGRRRFAFVMGAAADVSCIRKMEGFQAALAEHGLPFGDDQIDQGQWSVEGGYRAMGRLMESYGPDAVATSHDGMTLGAMRRAQEAGMSVPDDIAFTGFDDLPFAGYTTPALTTVRTPRAALGRTAAELLVKVVQERPDHVSKLIYKPELVVRESCGVQASRVKGAWSRGVVS